MKKLSDTVIYAISIKGVDILKSSHRFCAIIEDLSPQLVKDISFIKKAYSDQLGELIYMAATANKINKETRVNEIKKYLKTEEGRDKKWVDRILRYFAKCIYDNEGSPLKASKKTKKVKKHTKKFVSRSTIYVYKAPNRMIFVFSLVLQVFCFYLINYISYRNNNDGIFSYEIYLNDGRGAGTLCVLAFAVFVFTMAMGKDGLNVCNIIPLAVETILVIVCGKNSGVILVMYYCMIAQSFVDFDEESEKHHKMIVLGVIVFMEIAIGVIIGIFFRNHLPEFTIMPKIVWIIYILEFCSIMVIAYYLLNSRGQQLEYRSNYELKISPIYELSEIDPLNLFMGFFIGNVVLLIEGIIIFITRIFKKGAFSLLSEIGMIRISLLATVFLLVVGIVTDRDRYQKKGGTWEIDNE